MRKVGNVNKGDDTMKTATVIFIFGLFSGAVFSETTVTINGKTIRTSGSSVTVNNNVVIVDGKVLSGNVVEGSGEEATGHRDLGNFQALHLNISAEVWKEAAVQDHSRRQHSPFDPHRMRRQCAKDLRQRKLFIESKGGDCNRDAAAHTRGDQWTRKDGHHGSHER